MVLTKAAAVVLALGLIAVGGHRADSRAQPPVPERGQSPRRVPSKAVAEDFGNEPDRRKDFLLAEIGNLPPVVQSGRGPALNGREIVLYRDGSAKLWSFQAHDPVCPPLRHDDPIREVSFFDQSGLLVTTSARSVKLWDGGTGALRKEIPGQFMRPLFFLQSKSGAPRFATVDLAGTVVTVWDARKLEALAKIEPKGNPSIIGAAVSPDGAILATIAEDHRVTLWQVATQREFASLCPPSPLLDSVFIDKEVRTIPRPVLQFMETFWSQIRGLAPSVEGGEETRKAKGPEGGGKS
jgi:hypothetical protein